MDTQELYEAILPLPIYDVHTHIEADAPGALGLHDILLYHMVVSDLYSAGCPDGARVRDRRDRKEAAQRLSHAVPYLPSIRNTSCFWGVRLILADLYDWHEPVTEENWRALDAQIRERSEDSTWSETVVERANVVRLTTELARRGGGQLDPICDYSLEWAFFARTQQGMNDAPLYELERTMTAQKPGEPLEFTQAGARPPAPRLESVDAVNAAVAHYCSVMPTDQIVSTAQHLSTEISYSLPTEAEMASALGRRDAASEDDRDIYASYILNAFLRELEASGEGVAFILSLGAEPLPYETAARLHQETIAHYAQIIARYPGLRFVCMNASRHANQSLCTLSRELPNLTLAGYWWHSFFPDAMRQIIGERLDMLPSSNQIAFFSDAYCVEWIYAKTRVVKRQLAAALAERVLQGRFSAVEAVGIAEEILLQTPKRLLLPAG